MGSGEYRLEELAILTQTNRNQEQRDLPKFGVVKFVDFLWQTATRRALENQGERIPCLAGEIMGGQVIALYQFEGDLLIVDVILFRALVYFEGLIDFIAKTRG